MENSGHYRIAVLGAGSIGCYLGGCLIAAGQQVTLIGRQRLQQQLHEYGLHLSDWRGRDVRLEFDQIPFSLSDDALAEADCVLVTVKSGATEAAAKQIAAKAAPNAIVVSLQNGIRNVDTLNQYLPNHHVLKGMVPFNVVGSAGQFHCGTEGDIAIEDSSGCAKPLFEALRQAQLSAECYDNLTGIQWGKLLMNLNNAINALAGVPLQQQLKDRDYRNVLAASIGEALAVLKTAGITVAKTGKVRPTLLPTLLRLPNWLFLRLASAMLKIDPKARSSMYEDLALGRPTEIDFLNGEIVVLAEQLKIEAPVNGAIVALVKQAETAQAGSPKISGVRLREWIGE